MHNSERQNKDKEMEKKINKFCAVLVPIAQRDIDFYLHFIRQYQADVLAGVKPHCDFVFASLYQPGNQQIINAGFRCYDLYPMTQSIPEVSFQQIRQLEKDFSITNLHKLILHEKVTFSVFNNQQLYNKFAAYLKACDQILQKIQLDFPDRHYVLMQELGGFIGPLSYYFAALKNHYRHYFTEPAFFKGRLHFNCNSLDTVVDKSLVFDANTKQQVQGFVEKYLVDSTKNKTVVAAVKDRHHYLDMGFKKVFHATNFKKLYLKIYNKYVLGHKQEYEHIFNHSLRYLKMLITRKRNSRYYTMSVTAEMERTGYFYFPFHVQLDYSLTVRSPEYLDQIGLVEKILQILPAGTCLVVKEHPASIGCLDYARTQGLLKNNNFVFMHPSVNSYDIIDKSCGVVTINSKVGAEAMALGKKVFAFGNAFYTDSGLVEKFKSWLQLESFLQNCAKDVGLNPSSSGSSAALVEFLSLIWAQSSPSELYQNESTNIKNFTDGFYNSIVK